MPALRSNSSSLWLSSILPPTTPNTDKAFTRVSRGAFAKSILTPACCLPSIPKTLTTDCSKALLYLRWLFVLQDPAAVPKRSSIKEDRRRSSSMHSSPRQSNGSPSRSSPHHKRSPSKNSRRISPKSPGFKDKTTGHIWARLPEGHVADIPPPPLDVVIQDPAAIIPTSTDTASSNDVYDIEAVTNQALWREERPSQVEVIVVKIFRW